MESFEGLHRNWSVFRARVHVVRGLLSSDSCCSSAKLLSDSRKYCS